MSLVADVSVPCLAHTTLLVRTSVISLAKMVLQVSAPLHPPPPIASAGGFRPLTPPAGHMVSLLRLATPAAVYYPSAANSDTH